MAKEIDFFTFKNSGRLSIGHFICKRRTDIHRLFPDLKAPIRHVRDILSRMNKLSFVDRPRWFKIGTLTALPSFYDPNMYKICVKPPRIPLAGFDEYSIIVSYIYESVHPIPTTDDFFRCTQDLVYYGVKGDTIYYCTVLGTIVGDMRTYFRVGVEKVGEDTYIKVSDPYQASITDVSPYNGMEDVTTPKETPPRLKLSVGQEIELLEIQLKDVLIRTSPKSENHQKADNALQALELVRMNMKLEHLKI